MKKKLIIYKFYLNNFQLKKMIKINYYYII